MVIAQFIDMLAAAGAGAPVGERRRLAPDAPAATAGPQRVRRRALPPHGGATR